MDKKCNNGKLICQGENIMKVYTPKNFTVNIYIRNLNITGKRYNLVRVAMLDIFDF